MALRTIGEDIFGNVSQTRRTPQRLSIGFNEYGYVYPDGDRIPDEYLVRITSYKNNCTIIAPIQEDISLKVESRWEPFIPTALLGSLNLLTQAASKGARSIMTRAITRRMWMGTSPMSLSLRLKFEAVSDPFFEVVEPCRLLQAMTVPSEPSSGYGAGDVYNAAMSGKFKAASEMLPGVRPPGPTPFSLSDVLSGQKSYKNMSKSEVEQSSQGGDFIMIELGRFLTFWNVIISTNAVTYKSKFDPAGRPISSEVEVMFETYEMPTVESLLNNYNSFTTG